MNNFKDKVMGILKPYILTAEVNGETAKNSNYTLIHLSHESVANSINTLHNKALADKDKKIKELEDGYEKDTALILKADDVILKLKAENDRLKKLLLDIDNGLGKLGETVKEIKEL